MARFTVDNEETFPEVIFDGDYYTPGEDWVINRPSLDEIYKSVLLNDGPSETYFRGEYYTLAADGPITEVQIEYLVQKALEQDPAGEKFRDPEFDRQQRIKRQTALESGTPWAIDEYPEKFSREARLRRYGLL